jgi:hypothetical protein
LSTMPPFGETVVHLLAAGDGDDFARRVLAEHLDESGHGDFARIIRDRHWAAFRLICEFLDDSGFDPGRMRLVVQFRRKGKFRHDPRWIRYRTFHTRHGFPGIRVAFYRPNPTPSFLDPYAADPCRPRARRHR